MSNVDRDDRVIHNEDEHVPPEQVAGAHDADGTTGRVAGTGAGAVAGGMLGSAAGPVGTVAGAVAGGALGAAGGDAAHKVGDDHDDVNVQTGSDGQLGRASGTGAGALSGAIVGGAAGGPVGAVAGAVAGGVLGAAAGDSAKDMGGSENTNDPLPDAPVSGFASGTTTDTSDLPGVQTGGTTTAGADTRGVSEKAADAVTGDRIDDKTGGVVR